MRDHRPTLVQRLIALAFALGSVAVVALTVEMMVTGPLGELTGDPAHAPVALIGQAVNAVVSTVLWAYLASIAILLGGELNAVLRARREG